MASVAVYSELDRDAPHVARAGEAYNLGDGPGGRELPRRREDPRRGQALGRRGDPSGLRLPRRERTLREACEDAGVVFIGPPASAIEAMGSKTRARELMKAAGVPIVPGTTEPVANPQEALRIAEEQIGFPVAVKAAGGGGGKGFRVALSADELEGAFEGVEPGRGEVLLRSDGLPRALPARPPSRRGAGPGRHVRQRDPPRRARLLDPAPPPEGDRGVSGAGMGGRPADARAHRPDRRRGGAGPWTTSVRARSRGCSHGPGRGAGVLLPGDEHARAGRALRDRDDDGIDIVKEGIKAAAGEELAYAQVEIELRGHAIECRINAEDASKNFAPAPGRIGRYREPSGPGVRVDSGVRKTVRSRRCTTRWWPS